MQIITKTPENGKNYTFTMNMAQDDKDLYFFKGQSSELDWFVKELKKVAEAYNRTNLDPDTDGIDVD